MTDAMSFTTQPAKVIGKNDVIVSATSNLDDAETSVGFEWRKVGEDESLFDSSKGQAYLYEGTMEALVNTTENGLDCEFVASTKFLAEEDDLAVL